MTGGCGIDEKAMWGAPDFTGVLWLAFSVMSSFSMRDIGYCSAQASRVEKGATVVLLKVKTFLI